MGKWTEPAAVADLLDANHYLGASRRGLAWLDEFGVIVIAKPTSRRLPLDWLELTRWCITSREENAGSRQWSKFRRALVEKFPEATTVISYSDPSVGHTGALYRACNWLWAPTWHRLRPPPTGLGSWRSGVKQSVKDRWVFPLRPDHRRVEILMLDDSSILKRKPWAAFIEGRGADYKVFKASI